MEQWQLHQKHDTEINKILHDGGCLNSKNQIVRWNGPKIWPQILAAGHTSIGFSDCDCSRKNKWDSTKI